MQVFALNRFVGNNFANKWCVEINERVLIRSAFTVSMSFQIKLTALFLRQVEQVRTIPLIGKDGDDVIDIITCELTGTESINTHT